MSDNPSPVFPMFAHPTETPDGMLFDHVFPLRSQVRLCGYREDIVSVAVRIAGTDESETHWGWLDVGTDQPTLIWRNYGQLCLCFQGDAAMQEQIRRGKGAPVRLIVAIEQPIMIA
jgi:hypothetical protein